MLSVITTGATSKTTVTTGVPGSVASWLKQFWFELKPTRVDLLVVSGHSYTDMCNGNHVRWLYSDCLIAIFMFVLSLDMATAKDASFLGSCDRLSMHRAVWQYE